MPSSLVLKFRFPERGGPSQARSRPEHRRAVAATHYVTRRTLRTFHCRYGCRCGWHQHEHEHGERGDEAHTPSVAQPRSAAIASMAPRLGPLSVAGTVPRVPAVSGTPASRGYYR